MYTRQDLITHTNVTRRQLKRWQERNLLPPPILPNGNPKYAVYSDEHIRRIERIKEVLIDGRVTIGDLAERFRYEAHPELLDEECDFCAPHSCECESQW